MSTPYHTGASLLLLVVVASSLAALSPTRHLSTGLKPSMVLQRPQQTGVLQQVTTRKLEVSRGLNRAGGFSRAMEQLSRRSSRQREMHAFATTSSSLNLTPNLEKEVVRLKSAPDNTLRHQQLLYYAKEAQPLPSQFQKAENKVPGCLSTVYVVAVKDEDGKVFFRGDSDALITKGLVNLLIRGLSGYSVEEIVAVKPEFIQEAGITQSLTPGRNNGFLNMLNTMKKKAVQVTRE
eukprot:jgi/Bigna1/92600/estExt_fgenesh1_pm.C_380005